METVKADDNAKMGVNGFFFIVINENLLDFCFIFDSSLSSTYSFLHPKSKCSLFENKIKYSFKSLFSFHS